MRCLTLFLILWSSCEWIIFLSYELTRSFFRSLPCIQGEDEWLFIQKSCHHAKASAWQKLSLKCKGWFDISLMPKSCLHSGEADFNVTSIIYSSSDGTINQVGVQQLKELGQSLQNEVAFIVRTCNAARKRPKMSWESLRLPRLKLFWINGIVRGNCSQSASNTTPKLLWLKNLLPGLWKMGWPTEYFHLGEGYRKSMNVPELARRRNICRVIQ